MWIIIMWIIKYDFYNKYDLLIYYIYYIHTIHTYYDIRRGDYLE